MRNAATTAGSVARLPERRRVPFCITAPPAEHFLGPVVQLEGHFTGQDHLEVIRVGGVHPGSPGSS
jgi:hypothetical protein